MDPEEVVRIDESSLLRGGETPLLRGQNPEVTLNCIKMTMSFVLCGTVPRTVIAWSTVEACTELAEVSTVAHREFIYSF
jgi:hypothetical protein